MADETGEAGATGERRAEDTAKAAVPTPYDIAPEPARQRPVPPPAPGDRLLDAFDDDADLERDPEVERALRGGGGPVAPVPASPPVDAFVKPGMGDAKAVALVAAGVLLAAVIVAGVNAPVVDGKSPWIAVAAKTLYLSLVHTLTGVGAVALAAKLAEKPLGRLDLAAARMLAAVSILQLIIHLNIPIPGRFDEPLLAAGAYWVTVQALFRLRSLPALHIAAFHALFWFALWMAMLLHAWSVVAPAAGPAT